MIKIRNTLNYSVVFRGFKKVLDARFGIEISEKIWNDAGKTLSRLEKEHSDFNKDCKMMILPAAALYMELVKYAPRLALKLLKEYGAWIGERIGGIIHGVTSVPGVSGILWKNMPGLMRKMSSPEAGYTRRIVSETKDLVGVDILSCPLHDAAVRLGVPEVAQIVCAMDKEYMKGFKYINYTRTTSVAEGEACCDYRLSYDKDKS